MKRRTTTTIGALLLLAAGSGMVLATLPGPGPGTATEGPSATDQTAATVEVKNFEFEDGETGTAVTTIEAGQTVTWVWTSGSHSVTQGVRGGGPGADPVGPSLFDTGVQDTSYDEDGTPTTTFNYTFEEPGVYEYYCRPHVQMTGIVVVKG